MLFPGARYRAHCIEMLSQFLRLIQLIGEIPFIRSGYGGRPRPIGRTPGNSLSMIAARKTSIAPLRG